MKAHEIFINLKNSIDDSDVGDSKLVTICACERLNFDIGDTF